MENYTKQLMDSGLTQNQAILYELLIQTGGLRASSIVRRLNNSLSRPLVYSLLNELVKVGLVEKNEHDSKVTRFIPAHPSKLHDIAEKRRSEADSIANAASLIIPRIVSEYNLNANKPGVRFFEGREGVRAVLNDSLTTKTPILSYIDVEAIETHYNDVNVPYMKERERLGILKKLILDDTEFVRNLYAHTAETQTEVRLIPKTENQYQVSMQIYDDKVSYLTLVPGAEIAVIIQDASISAMHRHLFEILYTRASALYAPAVSATSSTASSDS